MFQVVFRTALRHADGRRELGVKSVESFLLRLKSNQQKAASAAMKGEAFRLYRAMQAAFNDDANVLRLKEAAALTREVRKNFRADRKSLKYLAGQVAYRVESLGGVVSAVIGPAARGNVRTAEGFRRKRNPLSVPALEMLAAGGPHRVTPEVQAWVAYKLRRRMGEPVQNPRAARPYGETWHKKRQRLAAGRTKWKKIPPGMIPRRGTSLTWPGRPWVQILVARERANTVHNLAVLYAAAVRGVRWPGRWWGADGRYAGTGGIAA